ncbi:unnamed protein product [Clonostachys solani]|uniref:Infection structure specific protein n=1 Tax=Clonostachys solani TaxID=160281 RepID=A0A9P0EDA1_9HYPO|nr:unnamed protein product [Clonostachys solani]
MHTKAFLLSAAAATATAATTTANRFPSTCNSMVLPLLTGFPEPPEALGTLVNFSASTQCSTTFPSSITSEIASYGSALQKWYSSHSAEIKSGMASCSEIGVFTEVGGCGKALVAANTGKATGGASSATITSAASVSASGSEASVTGSQTKGTASSSTSEGIGARETGMAAAVVAAAGLVAAVL